MNVNEFRLLSVQQLREFSSGISGPYGPPRQCQLFNPAIGLNLAITSTIGDNLMSVTLQEFPFLLKDDVFPSRLLVLIMNEDYLHDL